MSPANKILTVSYGTFSCTIEGFEDPFGTMKQIAEYFRDLAAEDRYFGAEPPVPDAEALRHIAERETARRVEARMAGGGVHLRRLDDAAAAAAATPVMAAGPLAAPPEPAGALTPSDVIDPAPASVAERLSRIRAVVARARTQPLWPEEDAVAADEIAVSASAVAAQVHEPVPDPQDTTDARVGAAPADTGDQSPSTGFAAASAVAIVAAGAFEDDRVSGAQDQVDAADPAAVDATDLPEVTDSRAEADDIAAEAAEAVPTEGVSSDALAPEFGPPEEIGPAAASEDTPADHAPDYVRPDLPIARVAVLRKDDHAAAAATDRLEALLSGSLRAEELYDDDEALTAAPLADDRDVRLLDAIRAIGAAETTEPETGAPHDDIPEMDAESDATGEGLDGTAGDRDAPGSAEMTAGEGVEAGHREPVEPADTATPGLDETADAVATHAVEEEPVPAAQAHGLTAATESASDTWYGEPDDLASLEDDVDAPLLLRAAEEPDVTDADPANPGDTADRFGRATHGQAVEDLERMPEDASVDRLLAATNSQLESTEVNRRRSAIAHLKAAVAAARADRRTDDSSDASDTDDGTEGSALDKFREDLARVVRPRRPVDQEQARPSRRLPPLMLVSEQRIDLGQAAMTAEDAVSGPVRPRRVVTRDVGDEDLAAAGDAAQGGFADFAQSMGARDLPDMIEAAAAYSAFVEGRPSFSRPQLMQMMRAGDSDDTAFSREEQLRSFGLLLRQGRIQKLKRGQFTVADDTRFRPPHRHAGE